MVRSIILMRHAEREDRAAEAEGKDWISTAPRPQDPLLSDKGIKQAEEVGKQLKGVGITRILCSPMIRTVMTADVVAAQLGLGANSVCVEMGLVEEAKSFRGKTAAEPRPNWNPLVLPLTELMKYSSRIDPNYVSLMTVEHARDEAVPNTVREVHATLTDRDEITRDRCRQTLEKVLQSGQFPNECLLFVGHGATVGAILKVFENDLPTEQKVTGEKSVSCFSEFQPIDPNNLFGPWKSVTGIWHSGNISEELAGVEDITDRGL